MWGDKETTAPIPSVAPDGEQPFALTRNDSIPFTEEKDKSFDGMPAIKPAAARRERPSCCGGSVYGSVR